MAPFALCKDLVKDAQDNNSMRVVEYPDAHHSFGQFTVTTPITVPFMCAHLALDPYCPCHAFIFAVAITCEPNCAHSSDETKHSRAR